MRAPKARAKKKRKKSINNAEFEKKSIKKYGSKIKYKKKYKSIKKYNLADFQKKV